MTMVLSRTGRQQSLLIHSKIKSYEKDISKKVRSVIKEKQIKGEYMCTVAPYGYKKDKVQKNHLVIDENTSYIVKKIFNMYLNGNSVYSIRDNLNKRKIQSY